MGMIGITTGDPKGIGPFLVRTFLESVANAPQKYKIFGPLEVHPEYSDAQAAEITFQSLRASIEAVRAGEIQILVNAPVNKKRLSLIEPSFSGHTEWLSQQWDAKPLSLFITDTPSPLRISLVTRHISLETVLDELNAISILETIRGTHQAMEELFYLSKPKIAVCGLNPHAGEQGLFGNEEKKKILPAILQAQKEGIRCYGPESPDTVFWRAKEGEFDAVVALYHDQGLIPIKTLAFRETVQITCGLPILRLSVDHGTAEHWVDKPHKIDMKNFQITMRWAEKFL